MRTSIPLAAIFVASLVAGCVGQSGLPYREQTNYTQGYPQAQGQNITVRISDFAFNPQNITVYVNQTIVWVNDNNMSHLVYYESGGPTGFGGFSSPTLTAGMKFNWTPERPGTYNYICSIHPFMKGTITVLPSTAVPSDPDTNFCGWSTNATCSSDNDCIRGGCSAQVCQNKNEQIFTTCEYRDCFALPNHYCKCVNNQCKWQKVT